GFDAGDVDFAQLLHEAEDRRQLASQLVKVGLLHLDAGEMRHAPRGILVDGHEKCPGLPEPAGLPRTLAPHKPATPGLEGHDHVDITSSGTDSHARKSVQAIETKQTHMGALTRSQPGLLTVNGAVSR